MGELLPLAIGVTLALSLGRTPGRARWWATIAVAAAGGVLSTWVNGEIGAEAWKVPFDVFQVLVAFAATRRLLAIASERGGQR